MPRVGVIGGTGFATLDAGAQSLQVETPWGDVDVAHRREGDLELFLLRRHGAAHGPPHRIAHRANVEALARCRVDAVLALNAVGAVAEGIAAGSVLVPDDWLDLRKAHETFHDDAAVHVDVSEAYCPALRASLVRHARAEGLAATDGGVYAATEGPRLETRAEVRALRALGASVVGMTGVPEAALARERGLCYASLCLVTNAAAGVGAAKLSAAALKADAEALAPAALRVVLRAARDVDATRTCACRHALQDARL